MVCSLQTVHLQEVQAGGGQSSVLGLMGIAWFSAEPHMSVHLGGPLTWLTWTSAHPLGSGSVLKDCTDPLYLPFPGQQLLFLDYFHISWSQTLHHFFDFPMDMPQLA